MTATNRFMLLGCLAVLLASTVLAYPVVTISTPYVTPEPVKTTVIYNPYSGNTYVNANSPDYRDTYAVENVYAKGYYDGRYNRDPYYCQYDWFDRCKDGLAARDQYNGNDDYWYSRCHNYDPRDDEWYDRDCDQHYGRSFNTNYFNNYVPSTYNAPYYNGNTMGYSDYNVPYVNTYPQEQVYYVNSAPYTNSVYYQGY